MLLPESERHRACLKAYQMLKEASTKILYSSPKGIVLEDVNGNQLSITKTIIDYKESRK